MKKNPKALEILDKMGADTSEAVNYLRDMQEIEKRAIAHLSAHVLARKVSECQHEFESNNMREHDAYNLLGALFSCHDQQSISQLQRFSETHSESEQRHESQAMSEKDGAGGEKQKAEGVEEALQE